MAPDIGGVGRDIHRHVADKRDALRVRVLLELRPALGKDELPLLVVGDLLRKRRVMQKLVRVLLVLGWPRLPGTLALEALDGTEGGIGKKPGLFLPAECLEGRV